MSSQQYTPSHRVCSVDGCDRVHYGLGWCRSHYRRMKPKPSSAGHRMDRNRKGRLASKLAEDDVREIRTLRNKGMLYREIGRLYGVSSTSVRNVITGKTWRHVS